MNVKPKKLTYCENLHPNPKAFVALIRTISVNKFITTKPELSKIIKLTRRYAKKQSLNYQKLPKIGGLVPNF